MSGYEPDELDHCSIPLSVVLQERFELSLSVMRDRFRKPSQYRSIFSCQMASPAGLEPAYTRFVISGTSFIPRGQKAKNPSFLLPGFPISIICKKQIDQGAMAGTLRSRLVTLIAFIAEFLILQTYADSLVNSRVCRKALMASTLFCGNLNRCGF
jgi:hypothetical protein